MVGLIGRKRMRQTKRQLPRPFFGKRMLTPRIAFAFGALYLLTVALLIARYVASGLSADRYLALAIQQGAEPFVDSTFVTLLRVCVFAAGSTLAFWFLYLNSKNRSSDG